MAWRDELIRPNGVRLVGLKPVNPADMLTAGRISLIVVRRHVCL